MSDPLHELRAPLGGVDKLHLNNAGVAPMCIRARDAGVRTLEKLQDGSLAMGGLLKDYEAARTTFAKLVGCASEDLSFFQTCAAAISQAAFGIPLAAGDDVIISDEEYPSNAYPWHRAAERAGARVRSVPVNEVLKSITARTRVVAVSWVQYSSGTSVDLRAIADAVHTHGGWLVIDAIQGLGVIPFDLAASGVDVLCAGTHKWLLGPVGQGYMACAPGRAEQMTPLLHGAMTYGTSDDAVDVTRAARKDPRRFEPGSPMFLGAIAGAAAVALLLEIGIARVHAEALAVADLVVEGAKTRGLTVIAGNGPVRSPITVLVPRVHSAKKIVDDMRARQCSVAPRGGGVRVAPHAHNGPQHIERFFALWDELDR